MGKIKSNGYLYWSINDQKVHLIIKNMEITYIEYMLTRQSLDDWQEVYSKWIQK